MVNLRVTRWAPIVLLALTSFASAQNYHGRELVHAELVADTSAIVAGKPLTRLVLAYFAWSVLIFFVYHTWTRG